MVIKNIRVRPETVPNNGKGRVRMEAAVFSREEDARIDSVVVDLSSLGGNPVTVIRKSFLVCSKYNDDSAGPTVCN